MRDITLNSAARRLLALATSPEFEPDAEGRYPTATGPVLARGAALSVYLEHGPLPGTPVPRNKALRTALAERWPAQGFRVRNGWGNQARVSWTDGPTASDVEDFAWTVESLTPIQAHLVQVQRNHSLLGRGVAWLRDGTTTWVHSVGLCDVTEREDAIVAGVARIAGFDLANTENSRERLSEFYAAMADLAGAFAATLDAA